MVLNDHLILTIKIKPTLTKKDSRQDEKAKLESILLSSMNSQSQMGPVQSMKTSQYSTNNTMLQQHLTSGDTSTIGTMSAQAIMQQQQQNRFTGAQWPPRMPLGQHRPLPATYRCGICKKPGHLKNLCPDAVIKVFLNKNDVFVQFVV